MALSKPLFFCHRLKSLKPHVLRPPFPSASPRRLLSFATPEEAAAERRRRKRRLRIEPPLSSLRHQKPPPGPPARSPHTARNPNAPKFPEPISALTGSRLNLHNRILTLIRENDLDEAALFVRHSIYSNCRPTIYTANAVLHALLRQCRYADLLSLHRFITQASVAPNIITVNLLLQAYCDCRKTDIALEHFRFLLLKDDAPFPPSPTTYRILAKGLVDNSKLDQAVELKDDMIAKAIVAPDPIVYNYLMQGFVRKGEPDMVVSLYEELQEKLGGEKILDGIVYGNLMKGFFGKGMEEEAMGVYHDVLGEGSKVRFDAVSYNQVLDALGRNGKLEETINLFNRMLKEHNPPIRITVNLGTFNVMVDAYCLAGRFQDAITVFGQMGEQKCNPDALSYNNLIEQLGSNKFVAEVEELYKEMGERGINPDEYTYLLLVEACFGVDRVDDATGYFQKMVELGLRPNANAYNKIIGGLVNFGRLDEAKKFFDQMLEKEVKPNASSYELLLKGFMDSGRLDDGLKTLKDLLLDDGITFSQEMKEFVEDTLKKEGREEELGKLYEDVEKERAERLAQEAEEKARAEALAKEEEERKKREAAEKEAAAARASAAALELILGRKKDAAKEKNESELSADAVTADGSNIHVNGILGEEKNKSESPVDAEIDNPTEGVLNNSDLNEEAEKGAGDSAQQVSAS